MLPNHAANEKRRKSLQVQIEKHVSQKSFFSVMQQGTGLQFYYVIADPKVDD